jgi:hypothetical protein
MGADINLWPSRGAAVNAMSRICEQARRAGCVVKVPFEQELLLQELVWDLKDTLDRGYLAEIKPKVPFKSGGAFHPDNLEIVITGSRDEWIEDAVLR